MVVGVPLGMITIKVSLFQGFKIESFHYIQRYYHFKGVGITVYRGVLI